MRTLTSYEPNELKMLILPIIHILIHVLIQIFLHVLALRNIFLVVFLVLVEIEEVVIGHQVATHFNSSVVMIVDDVAV